MDYRYLLHFERDARFDVFEPLAAEASGTREDLADLIWLRGERRDDSLPTAALSLAEIEDIVSAEAAACG